MKSKIVQMKIVHKKPEDRAEVIADELFEKYNRNQQEDEDGDYSQILSESIKMAKYWKTIDQENGDY